MKNLWPVYIVPDTWEAQAKQIREKRDQLYGNIYDEADTDMRWVGDLGEICFNYWLRENGLKGFAWHEDNAAGKPDFTLAGKRIDVKTVKRKVPPKPEYTAQITAKHKDHPIDQLFFMSYEYEVRKLWLLGGISLYHFLKNARFYGSGEWVHRKYQIRPGHEIFNISISVLDNPAFWLQKVIS
jgi:hypothetical protein